MEGVSPEGTVYKGVLFPNRRPEDTSGRHGGRYKSVEDKQTVTLNRSVIEDLIYLLPESKSPRAIYQD